MAAAGAGPELCFDLQKEMLAPPSHRFGYSQTGGVRAEVF